ncbi:MAG: hypothetical protein LUI06_08510 [Ruminococcus sp.]|nr:hypothetical protein [Ruminococcus sp.]
MSVTKTVFTGTSTSEMIAELGTWLEANAADYFDAISYDATNGITCTIDDLTAFKCSVAGIRTVALSNGTSYADADRGYTVGTGMYQSDSGLMMSGYYNTSCIRDMFITKTANGHTAITMVYSSDSTYGDRVYVRSFVPTTSQVTSFYNSSSDATFSTIKSSLVVNGCGKTTLSPIVFSDGDYCESLFFTPFAQYRDIYDGIISVDGTQYAYNGMLAVK